MRTWDAIRKIVTTFNCSGKKSDKDNDGAWDDRRGGRLDKMKSPPQSQNEQERPQVKQTTWLPHEEEVVIFSMCTPALGAAMHTRLPPRQTGQQMDDCGGLKGDAVIGDSSGVILAEQRRMQSKALQLSSGLEGVSSTRMVQAVPLPRSHQSASNLSSQKQQPQNRDVARTEQPGEEAPGFKRGGDALKCLHAPSAARPSHAPPLPRDVGGSGRFKRLKHGTFSSPPIMPAKGSAALRPAVVDVEGEEEAGMINGVRSEKADDYSILHDSHLFGGGRATSEGKAVGKRTQSGKDMGGERARADGLASGGAFSAFAEPKTAGGDVVVIEDEEEGGGGMGPGRGEIWKGTDDEGQASCQARRGPLAYAKAPPAELYRAKDGGREELQDKESCTGGKEQGVAERGREREAEEAREEAAISMESCLTFLLEGAEQEAFVAARHFLGDHGGVQGKKEGARDRNEEMGESMLGGGALAALADERMGRRTRPGALSSLSPVTGPLAGGGGSKIGGKGKHYQFTEEGLQDVILRLLRDEMLSDEVLNRALDMMAHTPVAEAAVLLNTFWYEKIKEGKYVEAKAWLERALGGRSKASLRLVCVPINIANAHWVLVFADLVRNTVQEWDPASATGPLDPSRLKNVKDALEKFFGFEKLKRPPLALVPAPAGLPQQPDAVNCGVFVVIYLIQICFVREFTSILDPNDGPGRAVPDGGQGGEGGQEGGQTRLGGGPVADPPIAESARQLRSQGIATKLALVPPCMFRVSENDLLRYRLFLLGLILHSQTSHLSRTDPVLLSFVSEKRRDWRMEMDSLGAFPPTSTPLRSEHGVGGRGRGESDRKDMEMQRHLLLSLARDKSNDEAMQSLLLQAAMSLLNRFSSDGRIVFVSPCWYESLVAGNIRRSIAIMEKLSLANVEVLCLPIYHPGAGGWILARVSLLEEIKSIYLHGTHALGEAEHIFPFVERGLQALLEGHHKLHWRQLAQPLELVPHAHQVPVALVLLSMHILRKGPDARAPSGELTNNWGSSSMPGLRFDDHHTYFSAKVGILRWFLRHTSRA